MTERRSPHRHAVGAVALGVLVLVIVLAGERLALVVELFLRETIFTSIWLLAMVGWGVWLIPQRLFVGPTDNPARGLVSTDDPPIAASTSRALKLATAFGLGAGLVSSLVLVMGLLGLLNRLTAWAVLGVGLVALGIRVVAYGRGRRLEIPVSRWSWLWVTAAPALAVLIVGASVLPGVLWIDEPAGYDVLSYHLQLPREWHDAGRISRLDHNAYCHLPLLMEMHYLIGMHLRGGAYAAMYFAQYMHAAMAIATAGAVYGIAGGGARPQAVVAGAITLATPWTGLVGSIAYNEAALMLYAALCAGWVIRAIDQKSTGAIAVAGAVAGFACAAKLTAAAQLVMPAILAIIWLARGRRVLGSLTFAGVCCLAVSPWLIRNLVWTANPVFPEGTAFFGDGGWSADRIDRWRVAHHTVGGADVDGALPRVIALWTQIGSDWRYGYAFIPVLLVAMGQMLARQTRPRPAGAVAIAVIVLGSVVVWAGFTHVQGRFLVHIIPLGAIVIGIACQAASWMRPIGISLAIWLATMAAVPLKRLTATAEGLAMPDWSPMALLHPPAVQRALKSAHPIALAGDGRAFTWMPASGKLHYRTVFDVERRPGEPLVQSWTRGAPADSIVIVDPIELRRLTATYHGLGKPGQLAEGQDELFILAP